MSELAIFLKPGSLAEMGFPYVEKEQLKELLTPLANADIKKVKKLLEEIALKGQYNKLISKF